MASKKYRIVFVEITITWRVCCKGKIATMKKTKVLCYGVNKMPDGNNLIPGIHAEHDALLKLPPLKHKKKQNQTRRMKNQKQR